MAICLISTQKITSDFTVFLLSPLLEGGTLVCFFIASLVGWNSLPWKFSPSSISYLASCLIQVQNLANVKRRPDVYHRPLYLVGLGLLVVPWLCRRFHSAFMAQLPILQYFPNTKEMSCGENQFGILLDFTLLCQPMGSSKTLMISPIQWSIST